MALGSSRRSKNRNTSATSQKELLSQIQQNINTEPQANFLERLLAPLMAIGSVPDVIYRSNYEGANPALAYLENLAQAGKTTFMGEKDKTPLKQTSDILEKSGVISGSDTGSRIARGALGFAGDVLLDPTTYLSFGAGGVAKQTAQKAGAKGAQVLAEQTAKNIGKSAAEKLATESAEKAAGTVAKFGIGKLSAEITNPTAVKALQIATNPLWEGTKAVTGLGMKGLDKAAPELSTAIKETAAKVFKPQKYAEMKGMGNFYDTIQNYVNKQNAVPQTVMAESGAIIKKIKSLPEELQANIGKYIENPSSIPEESASIIKPVLQEITNINAPLTKTLVDNKLLDGAIENYFPRSVMGFDKNFIDEKFKNATSITSDPLVSKELEKNGYVSTKTLSEVLNGRPMIKGRQTAFKVSDNLLEGSDMARVFDTLSEGEAKGVVYDKNAARLFGLGQVRGKAAVQRLDFARGLQDVTDDSGNRLFLNSKEAMESFGKGKIPQNMEKLKIDGVGTYYAPREAVSLLKNYTKDFFGDEGMNQLVKLYDIGLGSFKKFVTGQGPAFVGYNVRNAIGDMTNMYLNGFRNPKNLEKGFNVMKFSRMATTDGIEEATKKYGTDIANLYKEALNRGVLTSGTQLEDATGKASDAVSKLIGQTTLKEKAGNIIKTITNPANIFSDRETGMKVAMMADSFERNGNWAQAAKDAFVSNFDYNNLSAVEKNVFKRIVPFYSFMRKNLEFQLENIAKNPSKYTSLMHLQNNIKSSIGADMSQEDWDALPSWMKEGISIPISKDGQDVSVITGFGLPTESINNVIGGNEGLLKGTLNNVLSSMSPALKVPIEVGTGTSLFTGKPISENRSGNSYENAPEFIKQLLGYTSYDKINKQTGEKYKRQTVNPYMAYALSNLPFVSSFNTQAKRIGELSQGPKVGNIPLNILNLTSGGRVYTKNVQEEKANRQVEAQKRLEEYLLQQGLGETYKSFYIPNELRQKVLETYTK